MALTETQQIRETIRKSQHILITFKKDFSVDAVGSALALYLILKKNKKLVDIACDGFVVPKNLKFLPQSEVIQPQIANLQKFIINVNLGADKIDTFSYNVEADQLKIYLTPKAGTFAAEDINTENSAYKYDLIFTLDTPDLESLGGLYQKFTEFFYNTTIINLDHQSDNEHYGQINLTDFNAVATSEILFKLIKELNHNLLDQAVATCLLAGLITKTKSFKTNNVTPATLDSASQLIQLGADREAIIKSLYRSRSLATLNLWGRVLARLHNGPDHRLVWSILSENDFVEARAEVQDLPDVVEELIAFIPDVEVVVLLYHYQEKIQVLVQTLKNHNALYLAQEFKPLGSKHSATFSLTDTTLADAEKQVIDSLQARLGQI